MILVLIDYLRDVFDIKVLTAFTYYSTRMLLAATTSLLLCVCLGPYFIKKLYALKIGQSIRKEDCPLLGQLHEKKQDTPTMGGLLILFSMLVSLFLWMDLTHIFTLILLFTTLFLGFVGGRDDYLKLKYKNTKGMSARGKLFAQFIFCSIICSFLFWEPLSDFLTNYTWFQAPVIKQASFSFQSLPANLPGSDNLSLREYSSRLYMPFFKEPIIIFKGISVFLMALLMFFVITGSSNAVNLTDGLDGLAAGLLTMTAASLAFIGFVSNNSDIARYLNILYIEGSGEIAIYLCALAGACLGFLWYNSHPAQVFMGDIGSLALGGVIGVAAVLLKREFLLVIIGGIFVAEALSVILQVLGYRLYNKKRLFLCAPLHHHFEYKGVPETKVVIRFWIVGLLLAIIGLASLKLQ